MNSCEKLNKQQENGKILAECVRYARWEVCTHATRPTARPSSLTASQLSEVSATSAPVISDW